MTIAEIKTFDIRNFLDRLEPSPKEKHKYFCPACGGNDLSIEPETGKYHCFNGCENPDVREALKPWAEVIAERQQGSVRTIHRVSGFKKTETKSSGQKKKWEPVPLPEGELVIARLTEVPADIPQPTKPQVVTKRVRDDLLKKGATETELQKIEVISYDYGDTRTAHRYQCFCEASEKKTEKSFAINRVDESGKTVWNKGNYAWDAYRQAEAIASMQIIPEPNIPVLLGHEGEKCVEAGRAEKLVGVTPVGGSGIEDWVCWLNNVKFKMGNRQFIFAHCTDNDPTGIKHAQALGDACARCGIPFVAIDLKAVKSDLKDKGDLADIIACGGMTGDQLAEALLEQIELIRFEQQNADYEQEDEDDIDDTHPEAFYQGICRDLGLPFEDCVTATAFDTWVYHQIFTGAEDWRVIDSAFYRWSVVRQIWEYQTDIFVSALIADAGQRAFRLSHSKEFGWTVHRPYGTDGHKKSAFGYCKSRLERPELLPANTHLLAFHNCVVDLRTGQQMPHDKKNFLINIVPLDYKTTNECPQIFKQFVIDSFGEEMLKVIQAFTSMFLDPTAPFGRFPHLIGQSGGGKGTMGRFWGNLFGEAGSGSASGFADLGSPEGRHQFLTNKRIFGFPDLGGHQQGVRSFYELVDNGSLTGRALFSPVAYSKQWFTRFWAASVDHLQIENAGDGWARRAYPIPVRSRDVKPDPDLRQKLESVKAEVISWALGMPREERDRILLSPPDTERAINAQLDAALYGDSTKSFVDLCLRPSTENYKIPHHLLHTYYVAYCREHGYTPLGMSKFISHLKTILPRHFVDRAWSPMVDGKRDRIAAHWEYLVSVPGAFMCWSPGGDSGENGGRPTTEEWACLKRGCLEGGLEEFDEFWKRPTSESREPTSSEAPNEPCSEPCSENTVASLDNEDTPPLSQEEMDDYLNAIAEGVGTAADSLTEAAEIVAEAYTPAYKKIFPSLEEFKKEIKRRIRQMGYADRLRSLG